MKNHIVIGLGCIGGSILHSLRERVFKEWSVNSLSDDFNLEYLYVDSSLEGLNGENGNDIYKGHFKSRIISEENMCSLSGNSFVEALQSRLDVLMEKSEDESISFHICAGLSERIESGSIVDVIAQIRSNFPHVNNGNFRIWLYLYLPYRYDICEEDIIDRINAYYTLNDLNAISVVRYSSGDASDGISSGKSVLSLFENQKSFDKAYVFSDIESKNGGKIARNELFRGVADFMFCTFSGVLMGTVYRYCFETGLLPVKYMDSEKMDSRNFMTFGFKQIEYPRKEIKDYGACSFASRALNMALYGVWQDDKGYVVGNDSVGRNMDLTPGKNGFISLRGLSGDYVMQDIPLFMDADKYRERVGIQFEIFMSDKKDEIKSAHKKNEWIEAFTDMLEVFYDKEFRGCGVNDFFGCHEKKIPEYAKETVSNVEKALFSKFSSGTMPLSHVRLYLNSLIEGNVERIKSMESIKSQYAYSLNSDLEDKYRMIMLRWNNINRIHDLIFKDSEKLLEEYFDFAYEKYVCKALIVAYDYSIKLLSVVNDKLLCLLNSSFKLVFDSFDQYRKSFDEFAKDLCRLDDMATDKVDSLSIKVYNPRLVRDTVDELLKHEYGQRKCAFDILSMIVSMCGCDGSFVSLSEVLRTKPVFESIWERSIENATTEMVEYSLKNGTPNWLYMSVLDYLKEFHCGNSEDLGIFLNKICNEIIPLVNLDVIRKAVCNNEAHMLYRVVQLIFPKYSKDEKLHEELIKSISGHFVGLSRDQFFFDSTSDRIVIRAFYIGLSLGNLEFINKYNDRL